MKFESREKIASHHVTAIYGHGAFYLPACSRTNNSLLTLTSLRCSTMPSLLTSERGIPSSATINYLLDGRIELSNNRAERSIKPFVMSRKDFLFANTPAGVQSSAVIFSLIETAEENGLDPYRYLTWILQIALSLDRAQENWPEVLSPWRTAESCR